MSGSPRLTQHNKAKALPPTVGKIIPQDSNSLIKSLLEFNKLRLANDVSQTYISRNVAQQKKMEDVENKLMFFEDGLYNKDRVQILKEELNMTYEDELSYIREYTVRTEQKEALREQIKREIEIRKAQEAEEKRLRVLENEKRRQAVMERIRLKEEEEARIKAEEEARIKAEEDAKTKRVNDSIALEMKIANDIVRELRHMSYEEDLSRMYEVDMVEKDAFLKWQAVELDKIRVWEAKQKLLDESSEENRTNRIKELAEKREKYKDNISSKSETALSKEDIRKQVEQVTKQNRIQNKAIFVTKKSKKAAIPTQQNESSGVDANMEGDNAKLLSKEVSSSILASSSSPRDKADAPPLSTRAASVKFTPKKSFRLMMPAAEEINWRENPKFASVMDEEVNGFESYIKATKSFSELRAAHNKIIGEMRAITLHTSNTASPRVQSPRVQSPRVQSPRVQSPRVQVQPSSVTTATSPGPDSSKPEEKAHKELVLEIQEAIVLGQIAALENPEPNPSIGGLGSLMSPPVGVLEGEEQGGGNPPPTIVVEPKTTPQVSEILNDFSSFHLTKPLVFSKGIQVWYQKEPNVEPVLVTILEVHKDDFPNIYYTIRFEGGPGGREKQTDQKYLSDQKKMDYLIMQEQQEEVTEPKQDEPVVSYVESCLDSAPNPDPNPNSSQANLTESIAEATNEEDVLKIAGSIKGWDECLSTTMATAAHHAAFFGFSELLTLFSGIFDCFVLDHKGRTPLFYAAMNNQVECAAILMSADGQWIDVGDTNGDTPIHAACISGSLAILEFFISCECNLNVCNNDGLTPSHLVKSAEALRLLAEANATLYCVSNNSQMPLHIACADRKIDCVKMLLELMPQDYLLWGDNQGNTPLHEAASRNYWDIVELICEKVRNKEDLNSVNLKEMTAAHVTKSVETLQILYKYGANLWLLDLKARNPLFYYCFHGTYECVIFLISVEKQRGKSNQASFMKKMNNRDCNGDTILHAACFNGHIKCVILLSYFIANSANNKGVSCMNLAEGGGFLNIQTYFQHNLNLTAGQGPGGDNAGQQVDFDTYASAVLQYGSRWGKLYDAENEAVYYLDRISNESQWERPVTCDLSPLEEQEEDIARTFLINVYTKHNATKLAEINNILFFYKNRYNELIESISAKYNIPVK